MAAGADPRRDRPGNAGHSRAVHPADAQPASGRWRELQKRLLHGQEIVARMQYLGKLKRRLYRVRLASSELPEPGTQLFSPSHGSSIGEVVLAARADQSTELLAVLQAEAAGRRRHSPRRARWPCPALARTALPTGPRPRDPALTAVLFCDA